MESIFIHTAKSSISTKGVKFQNSDTGKKKHTLENKKIENQREKSKPKLEI